MKCPRDGTELTARPESGLTVDGCATCGGYWVDGEDVFDALKRKLPVALELPSISEMKRLPQAEGLLCPADGNKLVTWTFQQVRLDLCPRCRGQWLDRGELDQIRAARRGPGTGAGLGYEKVAIATPSVTPATPAAVPKNIELLPDSPKHAQAPQPRTQASAAAKPLRLDVLLLLVALTLVPVFAGAFTGYFTFQWMRHHFWIAMLFVLVCVYVIAIIPMGGFQQLLNPDEYVKPEKLNPVFMLFAAPFVLGFMLNTLLIYTLGAIDDELVVIPVFPGNLTQVGFANGGVMLAWACAITAAIFVLLAAIVALRKTPAWPIAQLQIIGQGMMILVLAMLMTTGAAFWTLAYLGIGIALGVLALLYCLGNAVEEGGDDYVWATISVWGEILGLLGFVLQLGLVLFGRRLPPWRSPKKQKEDLNR